jgi:PKHD-type hydroxylase
VTVIVQEPWWVFQGAIDADACDRIVEHGLSLEHQRGVLRAMTNRGMRDTDIAWIREDWVYDIVERWPYRANRAAGWNFDVERMQSLQFGTYEVGGHYDWHFDMTGRPYAEGDSVAPDFYGLLRKISFTVQLSDPASYDGGELELELGLPNDEVRAERPDQSGQRGTVIVFPSFIPHRVTPVTRGVRYSLVGWICGKPWR